MLSDLEISQECIPRCPPNIGNDCLPPLWFLSLSSFVGSLTQVFLSSFEVWFSQISVSWVYTIIIIVLSPCSLYSKEVFCYKSPMELNTGWRKNPWILKVHDQKCIEYTCLWAFVPVPFRPSDLLNIVDYSFRSCFHTCLLKLYFLKHPTNAIHFITRKLS